MTTPTDGQFYDSYYHKSKGGERSLNFWTWVDPQGVAWVTKYVWAALFGEWPNYEGTRRRMVPDTSIPWVQHWFWRVGEAELERLLERAASTPELDLNANTGSAHLLRIMLQAAPMPQPRKDFDEETPPKGPKEKKRKRELKRRAG